MRVLILAHDHLSPAGPVAEAFADRGFEIEEQLVVKPENFTTPNVTFDFPDPTNFDALVPLGSPWGAWDDETIGQWLGPEIAWVQEADRLGVPVLGICFGGQLLARAHGGSVSRAPSPEIGWTTIMTDDPELVSSGPWFQFHYDRWTLPPGAQEIARNSRASQAFRLRRNLAVQFHPELTASGLQGWMDNNGRDLVIADQQDPDILMEHTKAEEDAAAARARHLVNSFIDQVARS